MPDGFNPYYQWLGIPPKDQPPHHYRLLAIDSFEVNADVIANAADRQMAHVRTFQTGAHSAESQRLLNEILPSTAPGAIGPGAEPGALADSTAVNVALSCAS